MWQTNDAYERQAMATSPAVIEQMPSDAEDSGLQRGRWHLWISPERLDTAVFISDGAIIQRWAYTPEPVACY